jgi:hypothetical protein
VLSILFFNLINFAACQFCSKTPQMKNFIISEYASGTWHLHSIMASIDGSLNGYSCGRGAVKFNRTHVSVNLKGKQGKKVDRIAISLKIKAPSIFKLIMKKFKYHDMDVDSIDFDVSLI